MPILNVVGIVIVTVLLLKFGPAIWRMIPFKGIAMFAPLIGCLGCCIFVAASAFWISPVGGSLRDDFRTELCDERDIPVICTGIEIQLPNFTAGESFNVALEQMQAMDVTGACILEASASSGQESRVRESATLDSDVASLVSNGTYVIAISQTIGAADGRTWYYIVWPQNNVGYGRDDVFEIRHCINNLPSF